MAFLRSGEPRVPLSQLAGVDVNESTAEAIGDWRYWVAQGFRLLLPAPWPKKVLKDDPAAFKALADRAFGRLPQPRAVTGDAGGPIEIAFAGARSPRLPK